MPYPKQTPQPFPPLPAIPASALPQYVAPTRASKALQVGAFTVGTALTFYAVLIYDFGQREHCFMPVRRWFDAHTQDFFTLSASDRELIVVPSPLPSTKTPMAFFAKRDADGKEI